MAAESTIVTGTTTGQQQVTVQQSTELAAIKSTRARYCVSPGPLVICPGSSVDGVRAHLPLVRCGDETPFACSRAWDMPPCPHQAFISYSVPLTRLSHCSPQVHVSSWIKFGLISSHLPDVTPESCLVNATSRHTKSLQSSQTQIQGFRQSLSIPLQRRVKTACATERRAFD